MQEYVVIKKTVSFKNSTVKLARIYKIRRIFIQEFIYNNETWTLKSEHRSTTTATEMKLKEMD
jgi:hypothetical protein